tara:strand:+ start:592 stop:828 length:237 start_codon:yes stop_codon:yes gene_type:complete
MTYNIKKLAQIKHSNREARFEYRKHMAKERRRIKDMGETGVLLYNDLQKAASEYKLTSCFLWKRLLKGQKFTSMKMKV